MASQIDVVDINDMEIKEEIKEDIDNNNIIEDIEETPIVKPKPKAKSRVKINIVNDEVAEEVVKPKRKNVKAQQEEINQVLKDSEKKELINEILEEVKATRKTRPELKEKVICPDCQKELTVHGLKYTHKKYCKANKQEEIPQPVPALQAPPPPGLVHQTTTHPSDEQIACYLTNQRKQKALKMRERYTSLVSKALP